MPRILFEKKDNAVWISHLDLMRVFQRAFKRAGLPLKHTQGFNPRPSVSIALPLSVGVASQCELLDFELDGDVVPLEDIHRRLNTALVEGVRIRDIYEGGRKLCDLSLLQCVVVLEYDNGYPLNAINRIREIFSSNEVVVPKKTKSGMQDQNIIPMIRAMTVRETGECQIEIEALVCCQNPTLNPAQLVLAIELYDGELKPDHYRCIRMEIYDNDKKIFR